MTFLEIIQDYLSTHDRVEELSRELKNPTEHVHYWDEKRRLARSLERVREAVNYMEELKRKRTA